MRSYHESVLLWKGHLERALQEDRAVWDWSSQGVAGASPSAKKSRAQIVAKSSGVWAASGLNRAVELLSTEISSPLKVKNQVRDGDLVKKGQLVSEWSGESETILAFERPYLNLASYVSGIATETRRLVRIVSRKSSKSSPTPRVTATRKTLPGFRDLSIHGVCVGGGHSHRVDLSGGILLKENHIAAAGGIRKVIQGARETAPHLLKVEIEVRDLNELREALEAQAEVVMLDNFSPSKVRAALKLVKEKAPGTMIEVSGGISEKNIRSYVQNGVHVISVGSLTHSVKAMDLSLSLVSGSKKVNRK